jgi:hypothetical protein
MFGSLVLESIESLHYRMVRIADLLENSRPDQLEEVKNKLLRLHQMIESKLSEFNKYQNPEAS